MALYVVMSIMHVGCSLVDEATQMLLTLRRIYAIRTHFISGTSCPPSCLASFPFLSFPPHSSPLLTLGYMETWMTSQCGSVAREGKSLGYSGLTRRRAGYADFSRSLHQHWGMALMQSKLPQSYGCQHITIFNRVGQLEHDVVWSISREINLQKLHWSALCLLRTCPRTTYDRQS